MPKILNIKKVFCTLLGVFLVVNSVFAKEIDLYDQPKSDAKVIGKIDLAAGVIPIFTPKDNTWIKVGDARNGNVGWVKSAEMHSGAQTTVTFTQSIINDAQGPQTFQIIRYGQPQQKLTNAEMQNMVRKMQTQQHEIQLSMRKHFEEMMKEFDHWPRLVGDFPFIMPIVIIPAQKPALALKSSSHPIAITPVKSATTAKPNNTPTTATTPVAPKS